LQIKPYFKRHPTHQPASTLPPEAWSIPEICQHYGFPTGLTGTIKVGLFEAGGGWTQSDINDAFKLMGLPAPTITDVSVDGTQNNRNPNDPASGEVLLDIQMVGGVGAYMGKTVEITVFWSQDFSVAALMAHTAGMNSLSYSWGADESQWGQNGGETLRQVEAVFTAVTAAGMIVCCAAGDNDSNDGGGVTGVDGPGSCPHAICCGGTSLPKDGAETVWQDNPGQATGEGTGGGYSADFPAQAWQVGCPPAPSGLGRMVPNVAANADPNTGYAIVIGSQVEIIGGTSAVAPMWAALLAATGAKGFVAPLLYQHPEAFNTDISGENGAYTQPPCPGPCTGMGSPKGVELAKVL
jgi:kumamolisin